MLWAVLALVAALAVVVGGAVVLEHRRLRRLDRQPGVFRCKARLYAGTCRGLPPRWSRATYRAQWVHDVLLLHRGALLLHGGAKATGVLALGMRTADRDITRVHDVKGLGPRPVMIPFTLDDGDVVHVAAIGRDSTLLAGPFVTALIARASHPSKP